MAAPGCGSTPARSRHDRPPLSRRPTTTVPSGVASTARGAGVGVALAVVAALAATGSSRWAVGEPAARRVRVRCSTPWSQRRSSSKDALCTGVVLPGRPPPCSRGGRQPRPHHSGGDDGDRGGSSDHRRQRRLRRRAAPRAPVGGQPDGAPPSGAARPGPGVPRPPGRVQRCSWAGRFVASLRAVMPALAAAAGMRYGWSLAINAAGGIVWGAGWCCSATRPAPPVPLSSALRDEASPSPSPVASSLPCGVADRVPSGRAPPQEDADSDGPDV
jgi:hypothetical protein